MADRGGGDEHSDRSESLGLCQRTELGDRTAKSTDDHGTCCRHPPGGRARIDSPNEPAATQMRFEALELRAVRHRLSLVEAVTADTTVPAAVYRSVVSVKGAPALTMRPR